MQGGEGDFGTADQGSEAFAMAFAGFAEEDGFDGAARAESFFDEAHAFDADGSGFGRQASAKRQAKLFEPAIVAAGEDAGRGGRRVRRASRGFAGCGH